MSRGKDHCGRMWARRAVGFGPFFVIVALVMCCARVGHAQTAPPSHARLELIADPASQKLATTWMGVLFHLDQGWHVYWQNPGDSGTPPKIEWHLPAGYRAGAIQWPTPVRLGSGSVIDYGYENQVLLMAPVTRESGTATGADVISADVKYVVCSEICIPGKAHLTMSTNTAGRAQWHALFQETLARLPKPAPTSWSISATEGTDHFTLWVQGPRGINGATFFPAEANQIENSAPQSVAGSHQGFRLTLKKSDQLVKPIAWLRGLIVLGPGQAFQVAAHIRIS